MTKKENSIFFSTAAKSGKYEYSLECTYIMALISKLENISIEDCFQKYNYPMDLIIKRKARVFEQSIDCTNIYKYKNKYKRYLNIKSKTNSLSLKKLYSKLGNKNLSIIEYAMLIDKIYNFCNKDDVICYQTTWRYIFGLMNISKEKINSTLNKIHPSNYCVELKEIIEDPMLIKQLKCLNLETIHDLLNLDGNLIAILFDRNMENVLVALETLFLSQEVIFLELIKNLENDLKKKSIDYDVLIKRNGFYENVCTLEEIAQQYGITRERIRQIEKRAERIVLAHKTKILPYFNMFIKEELGDKQYIRAKVLEHRFDNKLIGFMKVFASLYEDDIEFSNKYQIFYEKGSLEHIIDDVFINLPIVLSSAKYEELNDFEKVVVDNSYSIRRNGNYVRMGFTDGYIYSCIVDELFPNGFTATPENMNKVNEQLVEKYEMTSVNEHTLSAALARQNYCYIDKGKVINRKYVTILDEELVKEILQFISNSEEVVYYSTIYESFKNKLKSVGINNRYYLKGLIDIHLPENYKTKRDYISTGEKFKSSYSMVLEIINKAEGIFDLEMLRNKFPGVMDYVFMNCISNQPHIITHSYGRKFINVNKLNLSEEFINTSMKEIEYLFNYLKTDIITSDKIYSRMRIMHKELLEELPLINNHLHYFHY